MTIRFSSVLIVALSLGWAGSAAAARGGPDHSGYEWVDSAEAGITYAWLDAGTTTCVSGLTDDSESTARDIGFTFNFYGAPYTQAYIGSNGYVAFARNTLARGFAGQCPLPVVSTTANPTPNLAVYGFYQDLDPTEPTGATICFATLGTAPDRTFVVSWTNIDYFQHRPGETPWGSDPVTFQIVLYETLDEAQVNIQDAGTHAGLPRWDDNTTIGIENADGSQGISECNWSTTHPITDSYAVRFRRSDTFGIWPDQGTKFGAPGGTVSFAFEGLNFATTPATVAVAGTSAGGWTVTPSAASLTIPAAGGATPFSIDITVPTTAAPPDSDTITVTLTAGATVATATLLVYVTNGDDSWQPIADLPEALEQSRVVSDGTAIYAIGGEIVANDGTTISRTLVSSTYRWDPILNQWDECAVEELPYTVSRGGACAMNGHIYYVGGLIQLGDDTTATPALFATDFLDYDIAANTWTARTVEPVVVMAPNVVCDPTANRVYAFGGYVDADVDGELDLPLVGGADDPEYQDYTQDVFQVYDVTAGTWRDDLTTYEPDYGVAGSAVALIDGRIYMAGGSLMMIDDSTASAVWQSYVTKQVEIYDIASDTWSPGTSLADFSGGPAGVVFRDQFCVLGGSKSGATATDPSVFYADWWCYSDPMWVTQSDQLPAGVSSAGGAVLDGHIYVVGGSQTDNESTGTSVRWPTTAGLAAAAAPVICAADADADGDADAEAGADADADVTPDTRPDTTGDTDATDTAGDGGGGGDDGGCSCSVADRSGGGAFLSVLFVLGLAWIARRRNS